MYKSIKICHRIFFLGGLLFYVSMESIASPLYAESWLQFYTDRKINFLFENNYGIYFFIIFFNLNLKL